jgi:hypothetical protein
VVGCQPHRLLSASTRASPRPASDSGLSFSRIGGSRAGVGDGEQDAVGVRAEPDLHGRDGGPQFGGRDQGVRDQFGDDDARILGQRGVGPFPQELPLAG